MVRIVPESLPPRHPGSLFAVPRAWRSLAGSSFPKAIAATLSSEARQAARAYSMGDSFKARGALMAPRLRCGIVLGVEEDACQVLAAGQVVAARYASQFPIPRRERVSPGHLVALAEVPGGSEGVVWRWYDAVVLGSEARAVRLWEPAHGEVTAQPRRAQQRYAPGTRAYLSAGLPGAEWWVAGRAVDRAEDADVELDEVKRLYTEHDMWGSVSEP